MKVCSTTPFFLEAPDPWFVKATAGGVVLVVSSIIASGNTRGTAGVLTWNPPIETAGLEEDWR